MLSIFFACILDLIFGDPRWLPHPVRGIGWLIARTESYLREKIRNLKIAGILLFVFIVGVTYFGIKFFIWECSLICPELERAAGIILIYFAISIKNLADEAKKTYGHLKKFDIKEAREQVSHIVGRDTKELDAQQLTRATVESVAESTVDGVISVLFYAFIGGPVLVWIYKAINTLDSMVGYRNFYYKELGWLSAKADDVFNYIPSRISALLIPIASWVAGKGFLSSFRTVLRDSGKHPSPNSGIPEAAFAGALGVQLGGLSYYEGIPVHKPYIGQAQNKQLACIHIKEAIKLMYISAGFLIAAMAVISYLWNVIL